MKDGNEKRWNCGDWTGGYGPLAITGMIIGGIALAVLFAFLFGWAVMLLWNWLMPEIFGLKEITYWQGWGLVLLSHILLKGSFHGDGGHSKKKGRRKDHEWGGLKEEFRREIRKEFARDCCAGEDAKNVTPDAGQEPKA